MKMKSLLLGSAAGLVAMTGAQAADLPVKAKAVAQYVKICTLYGAGFYYVPGTDTCVKYSGYVRSDTYYNGRSSGSPNYVGSTSNPQGRQTLTDNSEYATRARGVLSIDGRNETAYGTVRTLIQMGVTNDSPNTSGFYFNRALIQFAGFTFGRSKSPFNIWSCDDSCRHSQNQVSSSNSSGGGNIISYTAEFGGGLSGTLWVEDQRSTGVANLASGSAISGLGGSAGSSSAAMHYPDFGANLTINQAWGYAGASIIGHNASAGYYGTTTTTGHPGEKLGWAAEVGAEIKLPWLGHKKDRFGIDFAYGEGDYKNSGGNNLSGPSLYGSGNEVAVGYASDGIYTSGGVNGQIQLTTAWAINTGVEHYWADNLRTSVYYNRAQTSYNGAVKASRVLCPAGATNCNPDWGFWQVGSRTVWQPVANLNIGLDVFYTGIETAYKGSTVNLAAAGARPAGAYAYRDQGIVTAVFRVQKNLFAGN